MESDEFMNFSRRHEGKLFSDAGDGNKMATANTDPLTVEHHSLSAPGLSSDYTVITKKQYQTGGKSSQRGLDADISGIELISPQRELNILCTLKQVGGKAGSHDSL